jgi:flagellar hook-basal body complex protein FliE
MSEVFIQKTNPIQQLKEFESKIKTETKNSESDSFSSLLDDALKEVDQIQKASDQQISKVVSGDVQDVHTAMIAMQKADLSFQMMMQVRNKLIDAYHEVMRMQV